LRAISEPVVQSAFHQREEDVETVDNPYERIRARLLAEPERYSWPYILVATLLPVAEWGSKVSERRRRASW
jgi:hypothetical protein